VTPVSKPSFGFGDLSDIAPGRVTGDPKPAASPPPKPPRVHSPAKPDLSEVDRAAERIGFTSREAVVRRRKRPPVEGPVDQLNVRAAISDINRFVEWCERRRYSYREGFAELVQKIDS
jgi:hypothetical protein